MSMCRVDFNLWDSIRKTITFPQQFNCFFIALICLCSTYTHFPLCGGGGVTEKKWRFNKVVFEFVNLRKLMTLYKQDMRMQLPFPPPKAK